MGTAGRVYQLVGGALIALITGSYQLPNKIISSGKTVIIVGTLILVWVSFISTAINSVMGYFEWNNTTSTPGFSYKVISLLGMTEFNVIEMSVIGFIGAVTIIFGFESFSMNKDLTKEKEGEGQGKGVGNFVIALFSNAVLRHFGDLSYGIYLWHFPIIIIGNVVYLPESQPLRTILVFALSYGLSYVSHRFVESPIRNLSTPRPALVALFGVLCSVIVAFLCFHILTGDEAVVALYDGFKAGGASLFMVLLTLCPLSLFSRFSISFSLPSFWNFSSFSSVMQKMQVKWRRLALLLLETQASRMRKEEEEMD